jgi:hypothetical protein
MQDPKTTDEWQQAVDAAHACLMIHDAKLYGLITGGSAINADRCIQILELGKARRIYPSPDAMERFINELQSGH